MLSLSNPKGDAGQIKPTNHNGILQVTAVEKTMGVCKKITIQNHKGRLSREEIERMVKDAEKYKADDKRYRKKVEARNALESYAYNMRNAINIEEISSKLSPQDKERINTAVRWALASIGETHFVEQDGFNRIRTTLSDVFDPIILKLIQNDASGEPPGTAASLGNKSRKNRLLSALAKFGLRVMVDVVTGDITGLAFSAISLISEMSRLKQDKIWDSKQG